jgi:hypothetical protein
MLKLIIFSSILMISSTQVSAGYDGEGNQAQYKFEARKSSDCGDLNPEMANWFRSQNSDSVSPLDKKIGITRNQGDVGWCFANAAADMMTYEVGIKISAAQVAKNYYKKSKLAWLWGGKDGGVISDAIDLSLNTPLCDENSFPTEGHTLKSVKGTECINPIVQMKGYKTSLIVSNGNSTGGELFSVMDNALINNKIIGVHYNANKLFKNEKNGLMNSFANHASTIVARYYDNENSSCRYIIRNTWGDICSSMMNNDIICKRGYYSVNEEDLSRSLLNIVLLYKK